MFGTDQAKHLARSFLRRWDVDVVRYHNTIDHHRVALLAHLGVHDLLDVGACVGQYAQLLRDHGYAQRIWSFEPIQELFDYMEHQALGDPDWHTERTALGSEPGELEINVSEMPMFSSALTLVAENTTGARSDAVAVRREVAPMTTVDLAVARHGLTGPLGLKVDVQGFESDVFAGATETMARVAFLEFEMSFVELYQGQQLFPELLQWARDEGFVMTLSSPAWVEPRTGLGYQINGLFVRHDVLLAEGRRPSG